MRALYRLLLIVALGLAGCETIKQAIRCADPHDCRCTGCNQGYHCEDAGDAWRCTNREPCPSKPRCPSGEVPEEAPYEPGGCAWTGQCVSQ